MNSIICSYLHSVSLQLCQDKTEIRTQGLKATPKKSDHQNWIQRKKYLYFSWFTLSIYRIQWSKQLLTSSCRKWQPTPVFFPGESHGWRSLVGYSPWGCKESDTTEQLNLVHLTFLTTLRFGPIIIPILHVRETEVHVRWLAQIHG